MPTLGSLFATEKPVIGVLHLPPLPGAPRYNGDLDTTIEEAVNNAKVLEEAGIDGIIVENYGDKPFVIRVKKPETLASMTVIVREIKRSVSVPIGVNVLRNSGVEAYSIAYAARAEFIRVNSYCEVRVSPEGLLTPIARELEEYRARYPSKIMVMADVDVKHSYPLSPNYSVTRIVEECVERASPDTYIVTGPATGSEPEPGYVAAIKSVSSIPILVGSGITPDNLRAFWKIADGFIVGTYLKSKPDEFLSIDIRKAEKLVNLVKELRKKQL